MVWQALALALLLVSCSAEEPKMDAPSPLKTPASEEVQESGETPADKPAPAPDPTSPNGASSEDGRAERETPSSAETFTVDPETLSFPVVFHLGDSGTWDSEESLKAVLAETQRILAQAKIEIIPQFSQSPQSTDFLDVTYSPEVPNRPGVNGISFGGADLEVFVKDRVGLGKVADGRPASAPLGRTFAGTKPGDSIAVGEQEARQARTTAHEIGHQLDLPHRQDATNLLASGTTGWTLNAAEIATMRRAAVRKFGAKFLESLSDEAP